MRLAPTQWQADPEEACQDTATEGLPWSGVGVVLALRGC